MEEPRISEHGKQVLKKCPASSALGIDEYTLIPRIGSLSDAGNAREIINDLIQYGYLKKDANNKIKRTEKGDKIADETEPWVYNSPD